MKRAFRQRPHLVDSAPDGVRLDVISPTDNADEIWVMTYWKDELIIALGIAATSK